MASVGITSRLDHLKLHEVAETGRVLGKGSYGEVIEMKIGGLK